MVANFNRPQATPPKSALESYDFSWLGRGYTISVKHNVPDGLDQRESSNVSVEIAKDGDGLGGEFRVWVTTQEGRTITSPKGLTDELIIKAFDELKERFEKVAKAEKYLGTYPKASTTLTPRPPVMR